VGRWALRKAVEDYQRWRNNGLPAVRIAVNVSPLQLRQSNFVAEIRQAISVAADAAAGLQLEITESVIMQDSITALAVYSRSVNWASRLRSTTSALASHRSNYLAKLPWTRSDRPIFRGRDGVGNRRTDTGLVIINLAHALRLNTVAEVSRRRSNCVSSDRWAATKCKVISFGKPVPVESFEQKYMRSPGAHKGAIDEMPKSAIPTTGTACPGPLLVDFHLSPLM